MLYRLGRIRSREKGVWNMRHAEQQGVCHPVHAGLNSLYNYTVGCFLNLFHRPIIISCTDYLYYTVELVYSLAAAKSPDSINLSSGVNSDQN